LQTEAFAIAEAKGHHVDFHNSMLTPREAALADVAHLYADVTALAQEIKRHGLTDVSCLRKLCGFLMGECQEFLHALDDPDARFDQRNTLAGRALIRAVLLHTEVDEAIDAIRHDPGRVGDELADVAIRLGDMAEMMDIVLEDHVVKVMEHNRARPYQYNTPGEHGETSERQL
jgi:NTP pyrophosphatase (non-canonical NTP hydrolase)